MFADQRSFLGIPNFGDVVSNLPFAVVGLWGLVLLLRSNSEHNSVPFIDRRERWPYLIVFGGLLLTAFGSVVLSPAPKQRKARLGQIADDDRVHVAGFGDYRGAHQPADWSVVAAGASGNRTRQRVAVVPERTPRRRRFAILLRGAGVFHSISVDRTPAPVDVTREAQTWRLWRGFMSSPKSWRFWTGRFSNWDMS